MQETSQPPRGRDIFVDGLQTPAQIGALFGEALGVASAGIVLEDSSVEHWENSWSEDCRIAVFRLEKDGDFAFKLSIDLDTPINVHCFPILARRDGLKIAWSVDESVEHNNDYHITFPDGSVEIRPLSFRETPESYACVILPSVGHGL